MPATRKNKIFFKQKHIIPNASFHTRHNSINVNLSVDSSGTSQNKAYISARSRHGRVFLNVVCLSECFCTYQAIKTKADHRLFKSHLIDVLETQEPCSVRSRNSSWSVLESAFLYPQNSPSFFFFLSPFGIVGAITLFLPPTFDGLIQIRRRHGSVEFLPEFARNARVVQGSDKGSLIRYAGPDSVTPTSTIIESDLMSDWLDHCLVGSRTGKIVIGISGVDVYEPPKVSTLIKRVKGMFLTQ